MQDNQTENKTRKPREANFVNITDNKLKEEIKNMVSLPNKDLHLNYVIWYKKDESGEWGLTVKGFPEKKWGIQHVFKVTWFAEKDVDGNLLGLKPAGHCSNQTEGIYGDALTKILDIYNKYKK
jgi:hypothetical protein